MDKIEVSGIEVYAKHGLFDAEKILGQKFIVDCTMKLDISTCIEQIEKTVHYGEVSMDIVEFMTGNRFDLLETLANQLAKFLLLKYPLLKEIELTIHKPGAPIPTIFDDVKLTIVRKKAIVYLGIGSNLGNKEEYLDMVLQGIMDNENTKLVRKSKYVETKPYGVLDQPDFLNGALQVETVFTPFELLDFCKSIESKAGRVKERIWGERTLDVDILLYDDLELFTEHLVIPHPELHMRDFVLGPMEEIAPYLIHPIYKKNMQELYETVNKIR